MPNSRITTVLAADDRYSRPLAATIQSIISRLRPGRELDLYLCDIGISAQNREIIQTVTDHAAVRAQWVSSLRKQVEHLPQIWPGISRAAYARLYIPAVLPPEIDRALYLDCDLIVRRCIGDLFDSPMGDFAAMCVADAASPYVSSPYGVPYWSRFGRRADDVNFNSGVFLMNLPIWRNEDLAGAAFKYLTDGRHHFMVDQEAINAVLPGRIGQLDPRWNQQTEHLQPLYEAMLPYGEEVVRELIEDPWIVHFTTGIKAWSYQSTHPFREEWFKSLDETPYRGWRPSRSEYLAGRAGRRLERAKERLGASRRTGRAAAGLLLRVCSWGRGYNQALRPAAGAFGAGDQRPRRVGAPVWRWNRFAVR
jgi:lipopolysaccharide biosynthesis glycosyltransferase